MKKVCFIHRYMASHNAKIQWSKISSSRVLEKALKSPSIEYTRIGNPSFNVFCMTEFRRIR